MRKKTPVGPRLHAAPDQARGRLKNGNPCGDYLRAPRCGARTRGGCACRQPAMSNGRCRLHGGLSTGPRTPEGRRRSQTARLVHGYRMAALISLRSRATHAARRLRRLTATRAAGHGVDRRISISPVPSASTRATAVPAGHGVHRSISINHRDRRGSGDGVAGRHAREAPYRASPMSSVISVVNPSHLSAGHGVHRSLRDQLRSSTAWLRGGGAGRRDAR